MSKAKWLGIRFVTIRLRWPENLCRDARSVAMVQGLSLEHFIRKAVSEAIARSGVEESVEELESRALGRLFR